MNKKMKMLLFGGIALVVLVVVLVVLLQTAPENKEGTESTTSSAVATVAMIEKSADDLKGLSIQNPDGSFHITPEKVTVKAESEGEEDTTETVYGIDALRDYSQDKTTVKMVVNALIALNAEAKVFDEVENKAEYGLDKPQATATLELEGGDVTLYLGAKNEATGVYYAMVEGDPALYTVAATVAEKLLASQLSYLTTKLLDAYDTANEPYLDIERVEIQRPDLEKPIILAKYSGTEEGEARAYMSSFEMVSPIKSDLNYHVDDTILPGFFGMNAESVVALYHDADAAKYGFDKPSMVARAVYKDTKEVDWDKTITVGNKMENGNYYALCADDGVVYEVTESELGVMAATANDMVTTLPLLPSITTVSSVDITLDGKKHTFEITNTEQEKDESEAADAEPTLEVTAVKGDGAELDVKNFKQFYQLLISVSVDSVNTDAITGDPALSVTYHYSDGKSDQLDAYIIGNERRMKVVINGEPMYEGRATFLEKLRTETANLLAGKDVDTDW